MSQLPEMRWSNEALAPRVAKRVMPPTIGEQRELLTPREREVAALIAQGLTNREIASRLIVAGRTAEGHVQNILNKLGCNSRVRIAVWAVEHGLHAVSFWTSSSATATVGAKGVPAAVALRGMHRAERGR